MNFSLLSFGRLIFLVIVILAFSLNSLNAQIFTPQTEFTRQDTLRGSITPEREWWDLTYYHLNVKVDIADSSISGSNLVQYKVLKPFQVMQIDLQEPMEISRITQAGESLDFEREGNAFFISLNQKQVEGDVNQIQINFSGKPTVAVRPPWDGGFTWTQDSNGNPFVATSNQGIGASIWWPNKDHPYDEVDSLLISVNTPDSLMDVSNGRLRGVDELKNGTKTWNWFVSNPINSYGVNINIGDYVHFSEEYEGEKGTLDLDYYVLRENLEKAKEQFKQVKPMMDAFEYWFGPYPFYEDGYKLVEVPYLGMEHQSSVTYGNGYENGYLGRDLSGSGWGLKFDFIIIHETGHEWFANSITYADVADMWIHEGFTNYSESLYLDYHYGEKAANEYVQGLRLGIQNDRPLIGTYGVHHEGSGDMYNKGGNLLHTLRQVADDDSLWRATLRGLNKEFYHQTVSTQQIEDYISEKIGLNLDPVFDQYLRDIRIPTLEYAYRNGELNFRWGNAVEGFNLPIDVNLNGNEVRLQPTTSWQRLKVGSVESLKLAVDPNYYVSSFNLLAE
ncbi:MAG: peptidase M1 [Balneola sp.]|jgi:aminopeptidase N|nr:peptidase M1 [Balneola sp.]MBE80476.1 peptidase M1 [Balneola sp.]|tara:strand:+ start:315 stop:1994 length:1680 start_codon:yes stop_codon:yes gene_type:complete